MAQRLAAAGLAPLSLALLFTHCALSPDFAYLRDEPGAIWIMAPTRVDARLHQWGDPNIPHTRFSRLVSGLGPEATLRVRALGDFVVRANGTPLGGAVPARPGDWREESRFALGNRDLPENFELQIDVANRHGPALLWARLEGLVDPPDAVATDATWQTRITGGIADGTQGPAIRADDTRPNPAAYGGVAPGRALGRQTGSLLALFIVSALAFAGWRRLATGAVAGAPTGSRRAVGFAVALTLGVWSIFLTRFLEIPLHVGFDALHHHAYVAWLLERGEIPLATDGWSTFHPPLFYAGMGLLQEGVEQSGIAIPEALVARSLPFLAGLVSVLLVLATARALWPGRVKLQVLSLGFASLLPAHVYSSAYFSNESLHTALATAAILVTTRLLLVPTTPAAAVAGVGVLIGLAALTKFTAVVLAPLCLFFLLCKQLAVDGQSPGRIVGAGIGYTFAVLAIAGGYYARNIALFGDPFLANWGRLPGTDTSWWQQPGFHTWRYYTSFGAALSQPFMAGFESFWDSVYSTLWGDGFVAGRAYPAQRHPFWNYDFMALNYWAGLPATGLVALGGVRAVRTALGQGDPGRRAAFSFLTTLSWMVLLGFLYTSLRAPFFSQAKASYGLLLLAPASIFFALGFEACDNALRRSRSPSVQVARAALYAGLFMCWSVAFLSFAG
ncbi:glycosyltransferase family 39 protein [Myxococcota bacterium]|nr:glycosyltransferase family 39 protein [Myxococcota bacterium]